MSLYLCVLFSAVKSLWLGVTTSFQNKSASLWRQNWQFSCFSSHEAVISWKSFWPWTMPMGNWNRIGWRKDARTITRLYMKLWYPPTQYITVGSEGLIGISYHKMLWWFSRQGCAKLQSTFLHLAPRNYRHWSWMDLHGPFQRQSSRFMLTFMLRNMCFLQTSLPSHTFDYLNKGDPSRNPIEHVDITL